MIKKCLLLLGTVFSVLFVGQIQANAAEATVSNWSELSDATANADVDVIKVSADLTATKSITISSQKTIDFQQHTITFGRYDFNIESGANLQLANFVFTGNGGNYLVSGRNSGDVTFAGTVTSSDSNAAGLVSLPSGSVKFDGVQMTYDNGTNSSVSVKAKNFTITNQSVVNSEAEKFFGTSVADSTVTINGGSKVTTNSNKGTTGDLRGQAWDITGRADFTVDGAGTELAVAGNEKQRADNGGIFLVQAYNSSINVLNGATMTVHSKYTSAVLLQSRGGVVNVSDYSTLNLVQDGDNNYTLGATLRFRLRGQMTFNIQNHAKIDIDKKSGSAAAVRMYESGNTINVKDGSAFIVHNGGNGRASSRGSSNNAAIQFEGNDSAFNLTGEDSNVSLTADYGAGIAAGSHNVSIDAGANTFFVIRGNTSTGGVFDATDTIAMKMGTMKYFDFTNYGDGSVFAGGTRSTFTAETTNLSMWRSGSNLDGNADRAWQNVSYSLSGSSLNSLDSTSDTNMAQNYGKTSDYSKMNGNNQKPIIQKIFVPTNADKRVYVRAVTPQGKGEEPRGAIDDEVTAMIGIYDQSGNELARSSATSKALADMYGSQQSGLIAFDAPDKDFLKTGWVVKVLSGERTGQPDATATIEAPDVTVQSVVPPNPAKMAKTDLGTKDQRISGKATGANLIVHLLLNGQDTGIRATADASGEFTIDLPTGLQIGDQVQILLQDRDGETVGVLNPPTTNSTVGNIEPTTDMANHDATFKAGTILSVTHAGELVWQNQFTKIDFGQHALKSGNMLFAAAQNTSEQMTVSDTRGPGGNWRVTAKVTKEMTSEDGRDTLENELVLKRGAAMQPLGKDDTILLTHKTTTDNDTVQVNKGWNQTDVGLFLNVPSTKHPVAGKYTGEISWSLQDVPGNN